MNYNIIMKHKGAIELLIYIITIILAYIICLAGVQIIKQGF